MHEEIWCVFGAYFFSCDLCINRVVERCVLGAPAKDDVWRGGAVLVTFGDVEWCPLGDVFLLTKAILGGFGAWEVVLKERRERRCPWRQSDAPGR